MGGLRNSGYVYEGPNNMDCSSCGGLYWGALIQRNYHIDVGMRARGAGEA